MNNKGQLYILAIIILILIIFSIAMEYNKIVAKQKEMDFEQLSQNYITEAQKVINEAIENGDDVSEKLSGFTNEFIVYAKTKDPGIGMLYMFGNGSGLYMENYLVSDQAHYKNKTLWPAGSYVLNQISMDIGGRNFTHNIPTKISKFSKDYIGGEFSKENSVLLDIGGVFYKLQAGDDPNSFTVVIKSSTEEGDILQKIKSDDSGWQI